MTPKRLLLCTDMDRTVIPNGRQPEHPAAREQFRAFCARPDVCLAYVTGRHRQLVQQAIADYQLPEPNFAITDVGSRIYQVEGGGWRNLEAWEAEIAVAWGDLTHDDLERALRPVAELKLQEAEKQNRFKLSYYLPLAIDHAAVLLRMRAILDGLGVSASLIWSVDEPEGIGLLDVLPENATKLHGLRFLQQQLGYADDELFFAGDSGNDLPVLGSPVRSVLVANASDEVKNLAMKLAGEAGHAATLYLAQDAGFPLGGNYAAGVLQGICHYHPELCPQFKGSES